MPSLKALRVRINSVKSTQKITKAMQMVAASKLRRAQERAVSARPFAERMERMLHELARSVAGRDDAPPLLAGRGSEAVHLIVATTSDRGLCGGFNGQVVRVVKAEATALAGAGKTVKILCVGRKARDQLRRDWGDAIIDTVEYVDRGGLSFDKAEAIARRLIDAFEDGQFDVCTIVYNRFRSVMSQVVTTQRLIPFGAEAGEEAEVARAIYEFEPDESEILAELLPRNLAVQLFRALLESSAGEQAARMTAMNNATRNAGDMIDTLSLHYNRTRQAVITKELIEIVTGAEAL